MSTWRKVSNGWVREGDGRFLPKLGGRRALRRDDAPAATLGTSLARTATCTCGWRATGSTLGSHRVRYEEASA